MSAVPAPERIGRQLLIVFAIVLVCYVAGFWGSEWWRHRQGPWEVTFAVGRDEVVSVEVNQPRLGIAGVRVELPAPGRGRPSAAQTVRFTQPTDRGRVPFGRVKFLDTTVLPGTVTLDLFGNEIELLPRVLVINRQEHAWRSGQVHRLEVRGE